MNYFIKALRMFGTPLRIEFKQGDNPFAQSGNKKRGQGKKQSRNVQNKTRSSRNDAATGNSPRNKNR